MKKHLILTLSLLLTTAILYSVLPATASVDFKVYPGAKLDKRATRDTNGPGSISKKKVYTTKDSLEKVAAFYKGIAKEYVMPGGKSRKGPQARFFIFDNGTDLSNSKHWIKVQRPALGLYKEDLKTMKTRDITMIVLVEK